MSTANPEVPWSGRAPASGSAQARLTRHGPKGRRPTRYTVGSAILGTIGEILITLGVILGLYVAWELVWTNIEAEQSQQVYAQAFQARSHYVEPKVDAVGTKHSAQEPAPVIDQPAYKDIFASLHVPRWDEPDTPFDRTISEGTNKKEILDEFGIGHYEQSQLPGQLGNFAIAAHRSTYGKAFANIDTLQDGDALIVETDEYWYVYRVTDHEIIHPSQVQVIAAVPSHSNGDPVLPATTLPPDGNPQYAYITLTSCHPRYSATQRYIVWGVLDYWMDKSSGVPDELLNEN